MPFFKARKKDPLLYGGLIVLQCLFWGIGNPMAKIGFLYISPFWGLSLRFLLSFCFFMLFWGKRIIRNIGKRQLVPCLLVSLFTAIEFNAAVLSLWITSATNAGFLMSTAILFTPFLSRLFLKTGIHKLHLIPIALVLAGLFFLCNCSGRFSPGVGELLALSSAVFGAFMLTFSAKYLPSVDSFALSAMQCGVTAVLSFIPAFILEPIPNFFAIPSIGWGILFYMIIGCTCLPYMIQNTALRYVSPAYVSLLFCSEPLFTSFTSRFMLGETLTARGILGAVMIMVSIVIASLIPGLKKLELPASPPPDLGTVPESHALNPDEASAVQAVKLDNPSIKI